MNELQAAGMAVSHTKAAFDLVKAIMGLSGAVKINGKLIELQREIMQAERSALDAVRAQAALEQRVRKLEAQLAKQEDWNSQKERYHLVEVARGAFAYALKPDMQADEPVHHLCQACFERGQKSVLQFRGLPSGRIRQLVCRCGVELTTAGPGV